MSVLEFCKQRRLIGHIYIYGERERQRQTNIYYMILTHVITEAERSQSAVCKLETQRRLWCGLKT